MSTNYRKIWEYTYGPIPKDCQGRSFEIHHIDGNRKNNNIQNLMCISIKEHYDIHFKQGDWGACQSIAIRMNSDPKLISEFARLESLRKVELLEHPWIKKNRKGTLGNEFSSETSKQTQTKRIISGKHNWLTENGGSKKTSELNRKRIQNGTHNFLGPEVNRKRIQNGTHNFIGNGEEVRFKNKSNAAREIVKEIRELKQKYKLKLGSGWTNKTDDSLKKLFFELKEKYNE